MEDRKNEYLKNKWKIIISSLVTLLPIVAGLILWDKLPDMVPSHWGPTGEVDAYSSKEFFVFGLPLLMLGLNLLCTVASGLDPKNKNHEGKPLILVYAIIPALTILLSAVTYFAALELTIPVLNMVIAAFGLMIVVIGNYLPKCKQNHTIGIKVPWTLASEDNWNRTHRFAGIVWVIGGAACMAILLSFVGKLSELIRGIPVPVMGGVCLLLFGVIAASGLRVLVERRVDYSKTANLVMTSVVMTIGLSGAKLSVGSVSVQGMVLATLIAVVMSLLFLLDNTGRNAGQINTNEIIVDVNPAFMLSCKLRELIADNFCNLDFLIGNILAQSHTGIGDQLTCCIQNSNRLFHGFS